MFFASNYCQQYKFLSKKENQNTKMYFNVLNSKDFKQHVSVVMLVSFSNTNAIYCRFIFCLVQTRDIRTSRKCNNKLIVIGQNTSNLLMYEILAGNWLLIFTIWLSWLSPIIINNAISYRYMIEELFPNSFSQYV